MQIAGSRVLLTGASRGIGESLARGLADAGADVALVARDTPMLHEVAASTGGTAYPTDIADSDAVRGLFDRVEADGNVDILVNNAAVDAIGPFAEMTADDLARVVAVNVFGYAELTRQAVPRMLARGRGHIVNVSSLGGSTCVGGLSTYNATKSFVNHFTMCLSYELHDTDVNFTKVEIGEVSETGLSDNARQNPDYVEGTDKAVKLGILRVISKEEVTAKTIEAIEKERISVRLPRRLGTVGWLSDVPRFITGTTEAMMKRG